MKTTKSFLKEYNSIQIGFNYENRFAFETVDVIKAMKEYAKAAIEEDRKNVAEYAKMKDGNSDSGWLKIDKDSIINAPKLELK